jgi:hypothetical protein
VLPDAHDVSVAPVDVEPDPIDPPLSATDSPAVVLVTGS